MSTRKLVYFSLPFLFKSCESFFNKVVPEALTTLSDLYNILLILLIKDILP